MITLYRDSVLLCTFNTIAEAAYVIVNAFAVIDNKDSFHVSASCGSCSKLYSIDEFLNLAFDSVVRKSFTKGGE